MAGKLALGSSVTVVEASRLRDLSILAVDTETPTRLETDGRPNFELQAYMRREAGKSAAILRFFRVGESRGPLADQNRHLTRQARRLAYCDREVVRSRAVTLQLQILN